MAHQDVVPVNPSTESEWDQAPFGGVIDKEGGWVWGRGAADCKNQVSLRDWLSMVMAFNSPRMYDMTRLPS